MKNPPKGTLTHTTKNGNKLFYNPNSNTFGIMDKNGIPQSFFKPSPSIHHQDTNMDYWKSQLKR